MVSCLRDKCDRKQAEKGSQVNAPLGIIKRRKKFKLNKGLKSI